MTDFDLFEPITTGSEWSDTAPATLPPAQSVASVASVALCRDGVASMARMSPQGTMNKLTWATLLSDLNIFCSEWLEQAVDAGWGVNEMFGWPHHPLARRVDLRGLATFLHGRPVETLDGKTATIRNRIGPPNTFYRLFDLSAGVPVWVAFSPENTAKWQV